MEGEVTRSFGYLESREEAQLPTGGAVQVTKQNTSSSEIALCKARLWRSGEFAGGVPEIVAMVTGSVGRFPCNKLPRWSEVRRGRVEAVVVSPDASEEDMS